MVIYNQLSQAHVIRSRAHVPVDLSRGRVARRRILLRRAIRRHSTRIVIDLRVTQILDNPQFSSRIDAGFFVSYAALLQAHKRICSQRGTGSRKRLTVFRPHVGCCLVVVPSLGQKILCTGEDFRDCKSKKDIYLAAMAREAANAHADF